MARAERKPSDPILARLMARFDSIEGQLNDVLAMVREMNERCRALLAENELRRQQRLTQKSGGNR